MTSNLLKQKVNEYLQIPGTDRTDEQNAFLLFADIILLYEGIESPKDITEEIEEHYYSIKNKELTAEHREIFTDIAIDKRQNDYENPCKPGRHQWKDKGEAIDRFCDVLNIKRNQPFHGQIKQTEIYEEDVKASDWYRYVMKYQFELIELFRYEIGKDFKDSPLKYFKTFCLKVMGISCKLNQPKPLCIIEHEPLFKQHKREDIYRKHYGGTPRADTTKRRYSDDWINKKIENGEELTIAEKKFRTMRKHVEIHRKQPPYKRYLSNPGDSPLLKYKSEEQIKKIKHYGGTSR